MAEQLTRLGLAGNTVFVDSVNGNDTTGQRGDFTKPFLTVAAGLAAAQSGDQVSVLSGTYNLAAGITIPDGVSLRGSDTSSCIIQMLGVGGATTLVTMGDNTRLEGVTLNLTSSGHHTLTGVLFGGTSNATAKLRTLVINVDNSAAGAGTSNVTGVLVQATGTPSRKVNQIRATTISVTTDAGNLGVVRGVLQDTSISNFSLRDTNVVVAGVGIGCEVNIASGVLAVLGGMVNSATADVSQTAGTLELGQVVLQNSNANGKTFTALSISSMITFSDPGTLPNNQTRFMYPGCETVTASEIKIRLGRQAVVKSLSVRAITAPGAAKTDTWTVRKNGIDTLLTTSLSGAAQVNNADLTNSVSFASGDDLSLKLVTALNTGTTEAIVVIELY